jgi:hypothetical protein
MKSSTRHRRAAGAPSRRRSHLCRSRPPKDNTSGAPHRGPARQQVQHAQADADQGQEKQVLRQAQAGRLARIVGNGQRPLRFLSEASPISMLPIMRRSAPTLPRSADRPAQRPSRGPYRTRVTIRRGAHEAPILPVHWPPSCTARAAPAASSRRPSRSTARYWPHWYHCAPSRGSGRATAGRPGSWFHPRAAPDPPCAVRPACAAPSGITSPSTGRPAARRCRCVGTTAHRHPACRSHSGAA